MNKVIKSTIILMLCAMPLCANTTSNPLSIFSKRKEKSQKTEVKVDTVFLVDTVFVQLEPVVKKARVINYNDSTLAAFDEDVNRLYEEWNAGLAQEVSTFDKKSKSPSTPDSVYQQRLAKMAENMVIEMPFNSIVKAHIKVYTERSRSSSANILGKFDYYMPLFESELDRKGLPMELRCVPIIESALKPRAYSRAGASGLWQFIYSTGKSYGLDVNSYIDERRDPLESTEKAIAYFEDLYAIYNDWFLVIAAYNCGPGNVNKAIRRSGGKRDYWDIYYHLPRETRGYVPALIAANYLSYYAEDHNIHPTPSNLPSFTDTVMVNKPLNLVQVSEVMNIDLDLLRDLNPQYRIDIIPGGTKSYVLTLPGTTSTDYVELEDTILAYRRDELIDKKRANVQPSKQTYASSHTPPKGTTALKYKVKSGDNLGFIADWYDVRVSDLRNWNNIYRNMIRVDQQLTVYVPNNKVSKYQNINATAKAPKLQSQTATSSAITLDKSYEYYQVRSGDNFWVIARRFPGVSADNIKELNGISSNSLKPGQYLKIKKIS